MGKRGEDRSSDESAGSDGGVAFATPDLEMEVALAYARRAGAAAGLEVLRLMHEQAIREGLPPAVAARRAAWPGRRTAFLRECKRSPGEPPCARRRRGREGIPGKPSADGVERRVG